MNLSAEYLGPLPDPNRWNDLLFLIEGPAVFHYLEIFASDWAYASDHEPNAHRPLTPSRPGHGDAYIQVVPSGPDIVRDALFEALICAIYTATKTDMDRHPLLRSRYLAAAGADHRPSQRGRCQTDYPL